MKQTETPGYKLVENLFAGSFIFLRAFLGTLLNYNVYYYDYNWIIRLCLSSLYATSLIWIMIILKMRNKGLQQKSMTALDKNLAHLIDLFNRYPRLFPALVCAYAICLPPLMHFLGYPPLHIHVLGIQLA